MGGRHADELLPAPFRALSRPSSSSAAPRCAAAGPLLCGRRSPIARAILFLGIGVVSAAVACRTGCAFSHCRLPFLGSRGLSSARMESASTTVPSIVVEEAFTEHHQREACCLCQYSAWFVPLVSYVDTTLTWVRLLNKADSSCREAPMPCRHITCGFRRQRYRGFLWKIGSTEDVLELTGRGQDWDRILP